MSAARVLPRIHFGCGLCDNTGWRVARIDEKGDRHFTRCICRMRAPGAGQLSLFPARAVSAKKSRRKVVAIAEYKTAAAGAS